MGKDLRFELIFFQAHTFLRQEPIVLAPMLIYSVAMTLLQQFLNLDFSKPDPTFFIFFGASSALSLGVQLWVLAMIHQGLRDPDLGWQRPLVSAARAYLPTLLVLLVVGGAGAGISYLAYSYWQTNLVLTGLLGVLALPVLIVFLLSSQIMPVAMIVEPQGLTGGLRKMAYLMRHCRLFLLRFVLFTLMIFFASLSLSVLLSRWEFIPPVLEGASAAYVLILTIFFYLQATQIDVTT